MSPRIWRWQLTEEHRRVHRRRQVSDGAVGTEVVVDVAPVEVEDLASKTEWKISRLKLVAEPGVEALDEWVLPGAARFDVDGAGAGEPTPVANRARGQF